MQKVWVAGHNQKIFVSIAIMVFIIQNQKLLSLFSLFGVSDSIKKHLFLNHLLSR